MTEPNTGPSAVDLHVGHRIRLRRKAMNVSQEALAEMIGLTFQQVQKYERGANRVSASKLFAIAGALECSVSHFFDGLEPGPLSAVNTDTDMAVWLRSNDAAQLAEAAHGLPTERRAAFMLAALNIAKALGAFDREGVEVQDSSATFTLGTRPAPEEARAN